MKTADEMFKELNLTKVKPTKYTQQDLGFVWELVFYDFRKSYEFRQSSDDIEGNVYLQPADITPELHKAINKRMEELGWL